MVFSCRKRKKGKMKVPVNISNFKNGKLLKLNEIFISEYFFSRKIRSFETVFRE